jgi:ABC-type dipeptide/oligopeptide/nickel transport system permease subunit
LFSHWWVYLPITLTIIGFGFAWNLLGDELNTLLNPRER